MNLAERRGVEREVYDPAEDSRLLATTVVDLLDGDERVLDVGTGSGFVAEHVRESTGATVVASDLNPHACRRARDRGLPAVRADLVAPFRNGAFDVVAFNPPYLPELSGDGETGETVGGSGDTSDQSRDDPDRLRDDWMEVALTAGETGREVIDPFLAAVGRVLVPQGRAYLLVSTLTGVEEVVETAASQGLEASSVAEESFPMFETLVVLELTRE